MLGLHHHPDYEVALSKFKSSHKWSEFKDVHMRFSKGRCPICECPLDNTIKRNFNKKTPTTITATIDHYRPRNIYPKLKFDHENYILMCSDCNNVYKGNEFPLYPSTAIRDITANKTCDIRDEKPLIVNPIYDNVLDLFKVSFRYTTVGKKVLELIPKHADGYCKEKAERTISMFSLGNCDGEDYSYLNTNVQNCRIDLLHNHYVKFRGVIGIMKGRKFKDLTRNEQENVYKEVKFLKLDSYGFLKSIMIGDYVDLIN